MQLFSGLDDMPKLSILERVKTALIWSHVERAPDVRIGGETDTYLRRWHLVRHNRLLNVYLHNIRRSDDDRALHSHPWLWNLSILLRGSYVERTEGGSVRRVAGQWKFRWGPAFHRLELDTGECWTLFITGPRVRVWGFKCPNGFVPWTKFTEELPGGVSVTGRGCGDMA